MKRNYDAPPAKVADADNKEAAYQRKIAHHGPNTVPLVFDTTGAIHWKSRAFLKEATKGNPQRLSFFLLEAAAITCRLIGDLDDRNHRRRLCAQLPVHPQTAEDEEAYQIYCQHAERFGMEAPDNGTRTTIATEQEELAQVYSNEDDDDRRDWDDSGSARTIDSFSTHDDYLTQ